MTDKWLDIALRASERGWVPDPVIRFGIRRLSAARLDEERSLSQRSGSSIGALRERMSVGPVALATEAANRQHYELPPELFVHTLGPRLKYSCCSWDSGVTTLAEAEDRALDETCRRARIQDGMDILELGCGWGSLTLWMATHYPNSRITAVSNSVVQRRHIESAARASRLDNLHVITADMNSFDTPLDFDRVVSVEMFEHMHNYRELLRRCSGWMRKNGLLFVHLFAHRHYAYKYQTDGTSNWMARHFFTGGVMPSLDFLPGFQENVRLLEQWWWDGEHYSRTAEAWLENMNQNKDILLETLAAAYGADNADLWYQRWRMFYLACAELWGYRQGREWGVAHYLFERRAAPSAVSPLWSIAC